jgi:hypothetical protein
LHWLREVSLFSKFTCQPRSARVRRSINDNGDVPVWGVLGVLGRCNDRWLVACCGLSSYDDAAGDRDVHRLLLAEELF